MRKRITALVTAVITAIGGFAAVGCTNGRVNDGPEEVRFYLWTDDGGTPKGFSAVLDAFNNGAGKDMGIKLAFSFDTQNDYKQKLNLSIASGQNDYDVVFDAAWIYLSEFAKKDYYYELSDFFNNDAYAGLKSAFTADYLDNNRFNNGIYGIPLTETFGEVSVAYIRKDWRLVCAADAAWVKPAGIAASPVTYADLVNGIDNFNELEYYLYWVKGNKTGVVPALSNNDATWGAWDLANTHTLPGKNAQDYTAAGIKTGILVRQGVEAEAYIRNGEVMAVNIDEYLAPSTPNGVTDFPAGFGSDSKWQEDFQITRRWAEDGIIGADVMSTTDADAQFKAGAGGAVVQTINNFGAVEALLKQNNEGAELEIYVNDPAIREKKDGYAKTDFKAWNFLCIPKTAPAAKRDKAMRFMNWLFEDRANHDLFQYGIKGKNWEEAKDAGGAAINNTVSTVGMEAYSFPAYELTWNSDFIRVQAASDPKVQEYTEYMYDVGRYVAIPYAEFTFDPQRTAALATAVNNATLGNGITLAQSYYLGQYANPVAAWNDVLAGRYANASLQAALKTIQEEVIYQLQAYLDR